MPVVIALVRFFPGKNLLYKGFLQLIMTIFLLVAGILAWSGTWL